MTPGSSSEGIYDTTDMIALVDADKYKYTVTYYIYKQLQDTGEKLDINDSVDLVFNGLNNSIKFKNIVFFFSGKSENTFRDKIGFVKRYKGNRIDKADPYMYDGKFEDLKNIPDSFKRYGYVFKYDDIEADDLISMLSGPNTFIISDDKDLQQIPGLHYDFKSSTFHLVSKEVGVRNLAYQLLVGDVTDNVPAIDGLGHVGATKILDAIPNASSYLISVIMHYMQKYGQIEGLDRFAESWMLLKTRINRDGYFKEKYKQMFMYFSQL